MQAIKEYLEQGCGEGEYLYYHHSKYPIFIDIENDIIEICKRYKNHDIKNKSFPINKIGIMTQEQEEEYILDCVEIFLK